MVTAPRDRSVAAILLLFAAYTIAAARDMSYMQGRAPGPGFAPFWIGVALALASLTILLRRPERTAPAMDRSPGPAAAGSASTFLTMIAVTVVAVVLVERLGMIAALALLLAGLVRLLGGSWRSAGLTAVILPMGLYALFGRWLQVPLPRGPWGF
jgi:putative tricarboxylic transport membrane protein